MPDLFDVLEQLDRTDPVPDGLSQRLSDNVQLALLHADGVLTAHDRRVAYWELDRITQRNRQLLSDIRAQLPTPRNYNRGIHRLLHFVRRAA